MFFSTESCFAKSYCHSQNFLTNSSSISFNHILITPKIQRKITELWEKGKIPKMIDMNRAWLRTTSYKTQHKRNPFQQTYFTANVVEWIYSSQMMRKYFIRLWHIKACLWTKLLIWKNCWKSNCSCWKNVLIFFFYSVW